MPVRTCTRFLGKIGCLHFFPQVVIPSQLVNTRKVQKGMLFSNAFFGLLTFLHHIILHTVFGSLTKSKKLWILWKSYEVKEKDNFKLCSNPVLLKLFGNLRAVQSLWLRPLDTAGMTSCFWFVVGLGTRPFPNPLSLISLPNGKVP